jgi:hypothetical protein
MVCALQDLQQRRPVEFLNSCWLTIQYPVTPPILDAPGSHTTNLPLSPIKQN